MIPDQSTAKLPSDHVTWNYTTFLNIAFVILAAAVVVRFVRTGGIAMLRMMGGAPDQMDLNAMNHSAGDHCAMHHSAMHHDSGYHEAQAGPADTNSAGLEGPPHQHDDQGHLRHGR